jgi:hypothetical protein
MISDPRSPANSAPEAAEADRLRVENEELRRQLARMNGSSHSFPAQHMWHPSGTTMAVIFLLLVILTA